MIKNKKSPTAIRRDVAAPQERHWIKQVAISQRQHLQFDKCQAADKYGVAIDVLQDLEECQCHEGLLP